MKKPTIYILFVVGICIILCTTFIILGFQKNDKMRPISALDFNNFESPAYLALFDESMIYQIINGDKVAFYRYYFNHDRTVELGEIDNL